MSQQVNYRLNGSTAAEPLVNSWAVWSDLVSPAPFSLHTSNYQIKTLTSYLTNPQIHAKACQNPKFIGGPFVDVPQERAGEVRQLLTRTEERLADNVEFAAALREFHDLLAREARGQSLEPFYEKVPGPLKGYVELVYDYYNNPIVRPIESLLYESPYYKREIQSLRLFRQRRDDERRFFLSTPRLPQPDQLDWAVPFESDRIDEFFRVEAEPRPLGHIAEVLGLDAAGQELLRPLLSSEPAPPPPRWDGPGARVRYFGHACVLVEWNGVSVITDPWIGVRPEEGGLGRLSYDDLPEKIDYVLITHGHHDHFSLETLLRLRHKIGCLVVPRSSGVFYADPSLKLAARRAGFRNVVEVDALDSIPLPGGEIIAAPFLGEHADLPHSKSGYVVRVGRDQLLFAADSNCLDPQLYKHLRSLLGPIDTVFLGMECVGAPLSWLYGALLPVKPEHGHDKSRRTKGCDSAAALNLLEAVGARRVFIYAMGNEPWLQYGMGLGPADDSPQVLEANKVLKRAAEAGFAEAARPYGKYEFTLGR